MEIAKPQAKFPLNAIDQNTPTSVQLIMSRANFWQRSRILEGRDLAEYAVKPKVRVTRIDGNIELPQYATPGSVGFDLASREDCTISPKEIRLIPSNVIIQVPQGYALILASRSSTPRKFGLMKPHGIGVIDLDYCGPKDEIKIQVYNFTDKTVEIKKGTKIAQGLFMRVDRLEFEEVNGIKQDSRGGFGSTG